MGHDATKPGSVKMFFYVQKYIKHESKKRTSYIGNVSNLS